MGVRDRKTKVAHNDATSREHSKCLLESLKSVYNDCYKMVLARTGDISCLKYILVHSPNPEVQQDQSHGLPKVGECGADGGGVEVKPFYQRCTYYGTARPEVENTYRHLEMTFPTRLTLKVVTNGQQLTRANNAVLYTFSRL